MKVRYQINKQHIPSPKTTKKTIDNNHVKNLDSELVMDTTLNSQNGHEKHMQIDEALKILKQQQQEYEERQNFYNPKKNPYQIFMKISEFNKSYNHTDIQTMTDYFEKQTNTSVYQSQVKKNTIMDDYLDGKISFREWQSRSNFPNLYAKYQEKKEQQKELEEQEYLEQLKEEQRQKERKIQEKQKALKRQQSLNKRNSRKVSIIQLNFKRQSFRRKSIETNDSYDKKMENDVITKDHFQQKRDSILTKRESIQNLKLETEIIKLPKQTKKSILNKNKPITATPQKQRSKRKIVPALKTTSLPKKIEMQSHRSSVKSSQYSTAYNTVRGSPNVSPLKSARILPQKAFQTPVQNSQYKQIYTQKDDDNEDMFTTNYAFSARANLQKNSNNKIYSNTARVSKDTTRTNSQSNSKNVFNFQEKSENDILSEYLSKKKFKIVNSLNELNEIYNKKDSPEMVKRNTRKSNSLAKICKNPTQHQQFQSPKKIIQYKQRSSVDINFHYQYNNDNENNNNNQDGTQIYSFFKDTIISTEEKKKKKNPNTTNSILMKQQQELGFIPILRDSIINNYKNENSSPKKKLLYKINGKIMKII